MYSKCSVVNTDKYIDIKIKVLCDYKFIEGDIIFKFIEIENEIKKATSCKDDKLLMIEDQIFIECYDEMKNLLYKFCILKKILLSKIVCKSFDNNITFVKHPRNDNDIDLEKDKNDINLKLGIEDYKISEFGFNCKISDISLLNGNNIDVNNILKEKDSYEVLKKVFFRIDNFPKFMRDDLFEIRSKKIKRDNRKYDDSRVPKYLVLENKIKEENILNLVEIDDLVNKAKKEFRNNLSKYKENRNKVSLLFDLSLDSIINNYCNELRRIYDEYIENNKEYYEFYKTISKCLDVLNGCLVDSDDDLVKMFIELKKIVLPYIDSDGKEYYELLNKYRDIIFLEIKKSHKDKSISMIEIEFRTLLHSLLLGTNSYVMEEDSIKRIMSDISRDCINNFEESENKNSNVVISELKKYILNISRYSNYINNDKGLRDLIYSNYFKSSDSLNRFALDNKYLNLIDKDKSINENLMNILMEIIIDKRNGLLYQEYFRLLSGLCIISYQINDLLEKRVKEDIFINSIGYSKKSI